MYETIALPPTQKQLDFARALARRMDAAIPRAELEDRRRHRSGSEDTSA